MPMRSQRRWMIALTVAVIGVLVFLTMRRPPAPERPVVRITAPSGTALRFVEAYFDVEGSVTRSASQAADLTIPAGGELTKTLETGHSGVLFEVMTTRDEPITLTLLDGDRELDSQTSRARGTKLHVEAGSVAELPGMKDEPSLLTSASARARPKPRPQTDNPPPRDAKPLRVEAVDRDRIDGVLAALLHGTLEDLLDLFHADSRAHIDPELLAAYVNHFKKYHTATSGSADVSLEKQHDVVDGQRVITLGGNFRFAGSEAMPGEDLVYCRFAFYEDQLFDLSVPEHDQRVTWYEADIDVAPYRELARQLVEHVCSGAHQAAFDMLWPHWRGEEFDSLATFGDSLASARDGLGNALESVTLLGETHYQEQIPYEHAAQRMFFLVRFQEQPPFVAQAEVVFPRFQPRLKSLDLKPNAFLEGEQLHHKAPLLPFVEQFLGTLSADTPNPLLGLFSPHRREKLDASVLKALLESLQQRRGKFASVTERDVQFNVRIGSGEFRDVKAAGKAKFDGGQLDFELVHQEQQLDEFAISPASVEGFHRQVDTTHMQEQADRCLRSLFAGDAEACYATFGLLAEAYMPQREFVPAAAKFAEQTGKLESLQFVRKQFSQSPLVTLHYDAQVRDASLRAEVSFGFENWVPTVVEVHVSPADDSEQRRLSTSRWIQLHELIARRTLDRLLGEPGEGTFSPFHLKLRPLLNREAISGQVAAFKQRMGAFLGPDPNDHDSETAADGLYVSSGTFRFENGTATGKFLFAEHQLVGVSMQAEAAAFDTFGAVIAPPAMLADGQKMVAHCLGGEAAQAHALMNLTLQQIASMEKLTAVLDQFHATTLPVTTVRSGRVDTVRLIDYPDTDVPIRLIAYYDLKLKDRESHAAQVDFALLGNPGIVGFDLTPRLWIHHFDTQALRRDGKRFVELGFAGELDTAYSMCSADLRQNVTQEAIAQAFDNVRAEAGELESIEYETEIRDDGGPRLIINYQAAFAKKRGTAQVSFEFEGMRGAISALSWNWD